MKKLTFTYCIVAALVSVLIAQVVYAPTGPAVPAGFKVTVLASGLSQPKGIVSALHRAGAGPFGHDLYVAESGANQIQKVSKTGGATPFASTGSFPVGVAFFGGTFAKYLYVGNAFSGGITRIDTSGTMVMPFALPGMSISGLDFGRGKFGPYLYAGEWPVGNIHRVDSTGTPVPPMPFASIPGQSRYLKFSHGNGFGTLLYVTEIINGDIYQVNHTGAWNIFASIGSPCLEGLDFSPGGAFGHYLYVGDVCNGNIYRVAPDGTWIVWASGFPGVADIHFEPVAKGVASGGGFTMYVVDGVSAVYAISK